jgi:cell wall-associated NlpC family hydrolase
MRNTAVLLALVSAIATAACGSKTTTVQTPVPRPFPGAPLPPNAPPNGTAPPPAIAVAPTEPADSVPNTGSASLDALLATAMSFQGTPYKNGGSDPEGFDCSGFVQWVYSRHGTTLPREVRDQWTRGDEVDRDEVKPGDLVFFETVSRGASHVGIALGGDRFVHAPSSRGVVRVERFSSSYWATRWVGARRVL